MKPPDQVPEGLNQQEYQRLVALYTLMGRHSQATRALSFLSELRKAQSKTDKDEAEAGEIKGRQAGSEFASALMQMLKKMSKEQNDEEDALDANGQQTQESPVNIEKSIEEDVESPDCDDDEDPMQSMKEQLKSIGLSDDEAEEYLGKLKKALLEMTRPDPPPREVPQDLQAAEYWELALRYKQVGWTEQARDALCLAIEIDGDGPIGKKAQCFLRSKIPRHPVPLMAEQANIQGYNQMLADEDEAKRTFEKLVRQYPDFEWPYGNLGSLLIKKGELSRAEEVLRQAVVINPYYINAWLHLSRVYAIESRFSEADDCLERVVDIDPADPNWPGIRELVDQLKNDKFN
ncbi:MAG: hypothetical protein IPJ49_27480 [Candidatus Obscuribacter sp.]|nr:hypothetical protein [Candidatus Obscuribacter sp.]